ncbi:MAG TPA: zinc ribbon domain-containing protein [Acidobacteria bacterium]|nr:zinc ribbon domain-containing protein [Acidobacteriota bacterium]
MPIYEYQCQNCGHEFEKIQKFSDRPVRRCPECGGKTEKLISRSAFVLKGGGWYADGYAGGKKAKKSGASSASSSSESTPSKGKTSSSKKSSSSSAK